MRILGIDPGLASCGYGIIDKEHSNFKLLDHGVFTSTKNEPLGQRLASIFGKLNVYINRYQPECISIESIFFNTNSKTALIIGEVRGVLILVAQLKKMPVFEYTPLQVKIAVTGYGRAEKEQIQKMVKCILHLETIPKPDDAADAIAIALCHAFSASMRKLNV